MAFNINIPGPKLIDLGLYGKLSDLGTTFRQNRDEAEAKAVLANLDLSDPVAVDVAFTKLAHMPQYAGAMQRIAESHQRAQERAATEAIQRGHLGVAQEGMTIKKAEEARAAEEYQRGLTEDADIDARIKANRAAREERRRRREAGEVVPPAPAVPADPTVPVTPDDTSKYWPKPRSSLQGGGSLASAGGMLAEPGEEELNIMPDAGRGTPQAPTRFAQAAGATRTDAVPELPPEQRGRLSNELVLPQTAPPLTVGPGPTRPQPAPPLSSRSVLTPSPPAPLPAPAPAPPAPVVAPRAAPPSQQAPPSREGAPQLRPPSAEETDLEEEAAEYMELAGKRGISTTRSNAYKAKAAQLLKQSDELAKQREKLWQGQHGAWLKRKEGEAAAESSAAKKMKESETEEGSALAREGELLGNLKIALESPDYLSGKNMFEFRTPNIPGVGSVGFDVPTPGKAIQEGYTQRIGPAREFYEWATGKKAPGAEVSESLRKVAAVRSLVDKMAKESVILKAGPRGLGAQSFTNPDREYLEASFGNTSDQREVFLARVNTAIAVNDRKKVEEDIKNAMLRDGRTTSEITHSIREYNKANPLFVNADGTLTEIGKRANPDLAMIIEERRKRAAGGIR